MSEKKAAKDKPDPDLVEPRPAKADTRPLIEKIGLKKLDLTIEEIDERISPRETNVFDK